MRVTSAIAHVLIGGLGAWLFLSLLTAALKGQPVRAKDIVFIRAKGCKGDLVECAKQLHFNGDWSGVELCRAGKCVKFEEVFGEKRN